MDKNSDSNSDGGPPPPRYIPRPPTYVRDDPGPPPPTYIPAPPPGFLGSSESGPNLDTTTPYSNSSGGVPSPGNPVGGIPAPTGGVHPGGFGGGTTGGSRAVGGTSSPPRILVNSVFVGSAANKPPRPLSAPPPIEFPNEGMGFFDETETSMNISRIEITSKDDLIDQHNQHENVETDARSGSESVIEAEAIELPLKSTTSLVISASPNTINANNSTPPRDRPKAKKFQGSHSSSTTTSTANPMVAATMPSALPSNTRLKSAPPSRSHAHTLPLVSSHKNAARATKFQPKTKELQKEVPAVLEEVSVGPPPPSYIPEPPTDPVKSNKWMDIAIEEAKTSLTEGGIPLGCVAVVNGRIVGRGRNQQIQRENKLQHAEMDCLSSITCQPRELQTATVYTTLSPCDIAVGAYLQYRVPKIVIGENVTFKGEEDYLRSRGVEVIVLQNEECIKMMSNYTSAHSTDWEENFMIAYASSQSTGVDGMVHSETSS